MKEWDDAILVGVVARTHGNRGEVIVNSETDFPDDRFHEGAQLMTRWKDGTPATLEVATMRMHQGRPVVRFKGYESINEAEPLAGLELRVDEEETEPLPEGEYYHRDLIGCTVVTDGGETIGRVTAVQGDANGGVGNRLDAPQGVGRNVGGQALRDEQQPVAVQRRRAEVVEPRVDRRAQVLRRTFRTTRVLVFAGCCHVWKPMLYYGFVRVIRPTKRTND